MFEQNNLETKCNPFPNLLFSRYVNQTTQNITSEDNSYLVEHIENNTTYPNR